MVQCVCIGPIQLHLPASVGGAAGGGVAGAALRVPRGARAWALVFARQRRQEAL